MEWARRLRSTDIAMLQGKIAYSETVPNPDFGFTQQDLQNPQRAQAVQKVIQYRLAQYNKIRPKGFRVRSAPAEDIRNLRILLGHLEAGQFITKFRKIFTRSEMSDDLLIIPARLGDAEDESEYDEILPDSPP
jgi:hypothetical protein